MLSNRAQLLRAAVSILGQLAGRRRSCNLNEMPAAAFERCQRLLSLRNLAEARSWTAASRTCHARLRRALQDLRRQLDASIEVLTRPPTAACGSVRDIYEDLVALRAEFDEVVIDLKQRLLAVTTEPIQLEGVYLGRFNIVLQWDHLVHGAPSYEVIALDPQPAATDSSVTHPHVRDGLLCEGEGRGAIRAAIDSGRLLDFFTIVAQTLASYNGESAYVSLELWTGVSCADCGSATYDEDRSACEKCECDLCCDCGASCSGCGRHLCNECCRSCGACRDITCETCLTCCSSCDSEFCERCLCDGECKACRDAEIEGEAPRTTQIDSSAAL